MAWKRGLKTTYYLRALGATSAEKSTLDKVGAYGDSSGLNAVAVDAQAARAPVTPPTLGAPAEVPAACSIGRSGLRSLPIRRIHAHDPDVKEDATMLSWDDYEDNLDTTSTEAQRDAVARRSFLDPDIGTTPPATAPSMPEPMPSAAVAPVAEMPRPGTYAAACTPGTCARTRGTFDRRPSPKRPRTSTPNPPSSTASASRSIRRP